MAKLVDPDSLIRDTEIVITPATKLIQLIATGNLSNASPAKTSGVIGQAVYSKLKELWKSESDLNKMKFPIKMITEVKGRLINDWDWADATTRDLMRDFGWSKMATDNTTIEESYVCIVTLGDMVNDTDQAWFTQVIGFDQAKTNYNHTGEVNEAVKYFADATHGDFDYSDYFKSFLRVPSVTTTQLSHNLNNLIVEQDLSALDYTVYKFTLDNEIDIKFTHTDAFVLGNTPYTGMSIDFLTGQLFESVADQAYVIGDVVQEDNGSGSHWWRCTTGGTLSGTTGVPQSSWTLGGSVWEAFPGEVLIGVEYYAYNVLVDANNTTNTCTKEEIYEFLQWSERQATDINADTGGDAYGTVYGDVCKELAYFVGDELRTNGGIVVQDFNSNDTNSVAFYDITVDGGGLDSEDSPLTSTRRTYPFVAAGTMVFSSNLVAEPDVDTIYTMYFLNDDAGDNNGYDFDTVNAIIVKDNSLADITGQITQQNQAFDYDYDGNVQRGTGSDETDAPIVIVAQGLNGAEWIFATGTITRATGLTYPVNAADELNYNNPA